MIYLDDYLAGGFRWTYRNKPVGKFHGKKDRSSGEPKDPDVNITFAIPSRDAEALCMMAIERCMRVGDYVSKEVSEMIQRWKDV